MDDYTQDLRAQTKSHMKSQRLNNHDGKLRN